MEVFISKISLQQWQYGCTRGTYEASRYVVAWMLEGHLFWLRRRLGISRRFIR